MASDKSLDLWVAEFVSGTFWKSEAKIHTKLSISLAFYVFIAFPATLLCAETIETTQVYGEWTLLRCTIQPKKSCWLNTREKRALLKKPIEEYLAIMSFAWYLHFNTICVKVEFISIAAVDLGHSAVRASHLRPCANENRARRTGGSVIGDENKSDSISTRQSFVRRKTRRKNQRKKKMLINCVIITLGQCARVKKYPNNSFQFWRAFWSECLRDNDRFAHNNTERWLTRVKISNILIEKCDLRRFYHRDHLKKSLKLLFSLCFAP